MDFTHYGCVVIVVMTHGGENGLLMAKDEAYCERDILDYFKREEKPTLLTKPVVLIIQVSLTYFCSNADRVHVFNRCHSSTWLRKQPELVFFRKSKGFY